MTQAFGNKVLCAKHANSASRGFQQSFGNEEIEGDTSHRSSRKVKEWDVNLVKNLCRERIASYRNEMIARSLPVRLFIGTFYLIIQEATLNIASSDMKARCRLTRPVP